MNTNKLRLGPLPRSESVKLTFAYPASLKADLDRYATLHAQTYGEPVDAMTLVPHMLEAFIARDRGFKTAPPVLRLWFTGVLSYHSSKLYQRPVRVLSDPQARCSYVAPGLQEPD